MTLLNTNYASGNLFTAGDTGGIDGASGINDICGRVNFGGFDFPDAGVTTYITNAALNIISGLVVNTNHSYVITGSYNADESPVVVQFSGTTLGSTITWTYCYQTGSYGATSTGSLISGTCVLS
jgi:hypothetical protein